MPDIFAAASVEIYFQCTPSLALGTGALLLFSAITLVLAAQTFVYRRKCKFMWVVVVTGGLEVAGYTSHMVAAETVNSTAYVAFLVLTMLAPNFLALVNYVVVGKIAEQQQLQGQYLSARSIAGTFFVIDWICIAVQGVGSGILASALQSPGIAVQRTIILGQTVTVVGLAIQLAFFATFTLVAGTSVYGINMHCLVRARPTLVSNEGAVISCCSCKGVLSIISQEASFAQDICRFKPCMCLMPRRHCSCCNHMLHTAWMSCPSHWKHSKSLCCRLCLPQTEGQRS